MEHKNGEPVNDLLEVIGAGYADDTPADMLIRGSGRIIESLAVITGTGAVAVNVLQLTGTVLILNQWAEITEITTLTNLTNVYATLYDGTNSVDLTADGVDLSTAVVGSFFTKDKIASEVYSASIATQCRVLETLGDRRAGRPFLVTQKNGADTFIRFHYTTTDAPVLFTMRISFEYIPMNGGSLVFL